MGGNIDQNDDKKKMFGLNNDNGDENLLPRKMSRLKISMAPTENVPANSKQQPGDGDCGDVSVHNHHHPSIGSLSDLPAKLLFNSE